MGCEPWCCVHEFISFFERSIPGTFLTLFYPGAACLRAFHLFVLSVPSKCLGDLVVCYLVEGERDLSVAVDMKEQVVVSVLCDFSIEVVDLVEDVEVIFTNAVACDEIEGVE